MRSWRRGRREGAVFRRSTADGMVAEKGRRGFGSALQSRKKLCVELHLGAKVDRQHDGRQAAEDGEELRNTRIREFNYRQGRGHFGVWMCGCLPGGCGGAAPEGQCVLLLEGTSEGAKLFAARYGIESGRPVRPVFLYVCRRVSSRRVDDDGKQIHLTFSIERAKVVRGVCQEKRAKS